MRIWFFLSVLICNSALAQSNREVIEHAFSKHPYVMERIKSVEIGSVKSTRQNAKFLRYLNAGIEEEKHMMLAVMNDHTELFVDDNLIALCFNPWNAIDYKARYKDSSKTNSLSFFWSIASNENRRSRYSRIVECFNGKKSGSLINRHEKAIRNLGMFQTTGISASKVSKRVQALQAAHSNQQDNLPPRIKMTYSDSDAKPFYLD